jgi:BirA family biotin operon repressor/biotin-[acetyl-CoA-carboxylase] ligase
MTAARTTQIGASLYTYKTVTSTNAVAFDRLRPDITDPFWITALRQTAGRGRMGRRWISEPGNLFASLALRDPAPATHLSELPFVAIVALHAAVSAVIGPAATELAIKWPNDILHGGAKISGILVESRNLPVIGPAVVIGWGVNCRHHPDTDGYPATNLSAIAGRDLSADTVFDHLRGEMADALSTWDRGAGFAHIRARWLKHVGGIGKAIRVRVGAREVSGTFAGVDDSGRLLVTDAAGHRHQISAGDVISSIGEHGRGL